MSDRYKLHALVVTVALVASGSAAQEVAFDPGDDRTLSKEEFDRGLERRDIFRRFDVDGDGLIDQQEFADGLYDGYDINDNDVLEEDEFDARGRMHLWSGDFSGTTLESWDIDGDGVVLRNEALNGLGNIAPLTEWDHDDDNALSREELVDGLWSVYDDNEDGVIEDPELTQIGDDMGDGGFFDW